MEFQPLTSPSLKKLFVSQIERMILSGELQPGTQLPAERELAEQMGVSRPVVNAGITEMASKGFLEIRPRKGVFVTDYRRTGSLATLISIMEYNGGLLPQREIRSLLEVHLAIEGLSLQRAISEMSDEDAESLQEKLDELEASTTPEEVAERCYAFDHAVSCMSGNSITPLLVNSFKQPSMSLWAEYGRKHGVELLKEHRSRIMDYARRRDGKAALAYLRSVYDDTIEGAHQIYRER